MMTHDAFLLIGHLNVLFCVVAVQVFAHFCNWDVYLFLINV